MKTYAVHDNTDSVLATVEADSEKIAVDSYNSTHHAARAVWAEQIVKRDMVDAQYMPDIDDPNLLKAEDLLLESEAKAMHWH